MIVFGDHVRVCDPRKILREVGLEIADLTARPPGLARHAGLVSAFLEASELAQGLADADAAARGMDGRWRAGQLAMALLAEIARDVAASWTSGFTHAPTVPRSLAELASTNLPVFVHLRRAEGYAFYAVYPEAYLVAARAARLARPGPRRVVGIRSIGTGLAAIVAEAMSAPLPLTVRPLGDPYRREIRLAPEVAEEWTADPDATIAIVDEGPGLSGSSFGAVADAIEARGVTRIECFPSHAGELGPFALPRHAERWRRVARHVVDADALLVQAEPPHALADWIADLVGNLITPLEDVSAGAWRTRRYRDEQHWPPSVTYQERRKFLARTSSGTWLAKFVGLGRAGLRALARARTLHAARFSPQVAGLCHGFLVERWHDEAPTLNPRAYPRWRLVDEVGRYLGFRAYSFPASERGASLQRLVEMARHNTQQALGARIASRFDRFTSSLQELGGAVRPIEIDGRMHAWEWLVRTDGSLLKTDALDHHAAHDLVGCQDVTWDLAGAEAELGFDSSESKQLASIVAETSGRVPNPDLLALMRPCYLAFQLGRHSLAIDTAETAEAIRLRMVVDRYATLLAAALGA